MASAVFEIKVGAGAFGTPGEFAAASAGDTIVCRIADVEGITGATWRFAGNHDAAVSDPTITLGGVPLGQTATFTLPAGTGQAWLPEVTATIDGGSTLEPVTSKVVVAFAHGDTEAYPVAINETTEQDHTHATVPQFNYLLENLFGGSAGATGAPGGETFLWTFATSTTDADPGSGLLRLDNADPSLATEIYIDLINANSVDMTDWLDSISDGVLMLYRVDARETNFAVYTIESVEAPTGYRRINLRNVIHQVGSFNTTAANLAVALDRGGSGSGTQDIFEVGATVTLGTAATDTVTYEAVTVPGVLAGDVVIAVDSDDQSAPTNFLQCQVTADDEITIPECNPSGGGDAIGELGLRFLIYRPGTSLKRYTATVDYGTAAAASTTYVTATVPGVQVGDFVVNASHAINAPSGTGMCRVTAANTVSIPVVNPSASGDSIGSLSTTFTVVRPGTAGFLVFSQGIAFGSVGADSAPHFTGTLENILALDHICCVSADLSATDLCLGDARCNTDDTLDLSAANPTVGAIAPGTVAVTALIWRSSSAGGPTGAPGADGAPGTAGATGATGARGNPGGESFHYTYSATTTDADPGSGIVRFDSTTLSAATRMYVDIAPQTGGDVTGWLDSIAANDRIVVYSDADRSIFHIWDVELVGTRTGYRSVRFLRYVDGNGSLSTTAGDTIVSLSRGGGASVASATANGALSVIGPWHRTKAIAVSSLVPETDRVSVWVPGYNQWLLFAFSSIDGASFDPEFGVGQNFVSVFGFNKAEGGLSGGIVQDAGTAGTFPGGWEIQGGFSTVSTLHSPIVVTTVPIDTTAGANVYIFAGVSRKSGSGSVSDKLWRSVDGGKNWTSFDLNRSDTVGPSVLLWTGTRLVVTYEASGGEVETSEITGPGILGTTWTNRTVPNTNSRSFGATDGNGNVILAHYTESFIYSEDHGVTWSTGTMPSFGGATMTGLVFCNGRFYCLLNNQTILWSTDGIGWVGPISYTFGNPNIANAKPRVKCLVPHGDLLVAYCESDSDPIVPEEYDLFVCDTTQYPNGNHWNRSGCFRSQYLSDLNRQRIHLASSGPESPAHTKNDRLQMLFFADQTNLPTGGGEFAEAWMSPADVPQRITSGSSSSTTTTAATTNALIRQNFSSTTTMADPGAATFRVNNATPSSVTAIALDDLSVDSIDVSGFIQSHGNGLVTIHNADFSVRHQYRLLTYEDNDGWTEWDVEYVKGTGTFVAAAEYSIEMDLGKKFPIDSTWVTASHGSGEYRFDWTFADEFPQLNDAYGVYLCTVYGIGSTDGHGGYDDQFRFQAMLTVDVGVSIGMSLIGNIVDPSAGDVAISAWSTPSAGVTRLTLTSTADEGDYAVMVRVDCQTTLPYTGAT